MRKKHNLWTSGDSIVALVVVPLIPMKIKIMALYSKNVSYNKNVRFTDDHLYRQVKQLLYFILNPR